MYLSLLGKYTMNIVYQTTNLINRKIYIRVHNKSYASYLESGTLIKDDIQKYSKSNRNKTHLSPLKVILKNGEIHYFKIAKEIGEYFNIPKNLVNTIKHFSAKID